MVKWNLVKQTHWTLDYIDSLDYGQLQEIIQMEDGLSKARGK
jgi:hypothetical protein